MFALDVFLVVMRLSRIHLSVFDSKILNRKGIYLSLTVQIIATFTRCENE